MGRDQSTAYTLEVGALVERIGGPAVAGALCGVSADAVRAWKQKGQLRRAHLDALRDASGEREAVGSVNAALRVALTSLHALQRGRALLAEASARDGALDEFDALAGHVAHGRDRLLRLVGPTPTTKTAREECQA